MIETLQDARSALEAKGLCASGGAASLLIGGSVVDGGDGYDGDGLRVFKDACALNHRAGSWVAVFPAEGLSTYEVLGTLPELVSLIEAVYDRHRQAGRSFKDACKEVVAEARQHLVASLARDVAEARQELQAGGAQPRTPAELMREALS